MSNRHVLRDEYPTSVQWEHVDGCESALPWTMTSFEEEYAALREEGALFDLTHLTSVRLVGDNAIDLLQFTCARDVTYLLPESSLISAILSPTGSIIDVVLVRRSGDSYLLESSIGCGKTLVEHLRRQAAQPDDVVTVDDQVLLGIEGPYSWKGLADVFGPMASSLPFQAACTVSWMDHDVDIVRSGSTAEYGFRIRASSAIGRDLWLALSKRAKPAGYRTLELAQLEVRHPTPHREIAGGESVTVCGFNWLVDPHKLDYCGKDAMEAARHVDGGLRTLGLVCGEGANGLSAGAPVLVGGSCEIGSVIWTEYSPGLRSMIGLARVPDEWAAAGLPLQVQTPAGPIDARSEAAPYVVPRSWSTPIS